MAAPVPAWPAERVVLRPIVDLVPRASNSRTHSASQIDQLCALMLEHGWTTAVLVGVVMARGLHGAPILIRRFLHWAPGRVQRQGS